MAILLNNGWKSGDWHLILLDFYNEQPLDSDDGVFGINIGLCGITIGIMFHYGD